MSAELEKRLAAANGDALIAVMNELRYDFVARYGLARAPHLPRMLAESDQLGADQARPARAGTGCIAR